LYLLSEHWNFGQSISWGPFLEWFFTLKRLIYGPGNTVFQIFQNFLPYFDCTKSCSHRISLSWYQYLVLKVIHINWAKLSIHPIKTEGMIITKQGFIGSSPPILCGDKYVNVVDHTTCLGLTIDNCLSWSKHICHIKKHLIQ